MPLEEPLRLKLKPREEDRLLAGHQWVFSNELEEVPQAEPGTAAVVETHSGRVLGTGFFNPKSLIAFRLLSRSPAAFDAEFFRARLEEALAFRRRHLGEARSFRLAFGESDGLPGLVADKLEDVVVLQVLAAGIERRLEAVLEALQAVVRPAGVYLRGDHPSRALEGLPSESRVLWGKVPERVTIEEGGLRYLASPMEGQKTGFYFDQRDNRAFLAPYCRGRTVLDFFCFSGAFALTAARHGAAKVLGLDSSEAAVELARENARLNGLADRCEFDEGDAEQVVEAFARSRQSLEPDLIVLDPPSYAPSRRHLPKALRAYARLNANALRALQRGGLLATATCSHHVSREDFLGMLRQAAAKAGRRTRLIELRGQAKDHPVLLSMPETEYLHFALLEVG